MGYGSAYGWRSLGAGLRDIGRIVAANREAERQRLARQQQEDRRVAGTRAEELTQPGTASLAEFLGNRENYDQANPTAGGGPLTEDTLRRVANAAETNVPIEFKRPAPEPLMAGGKPIMGPPSAAGQPTRPLVVQDRAPYLSPAGVVFDPQAARKERAIGAIVARQAERLTPEERAQHLKDVEDAARAQARGAGLLQQRTEQPRGALTMEQAMDRVLQLRGTWNEERGGYDLPEGADEAWLGAAARAVQQGRPVPPVPGARTADLRNAWQLTPGGRGWNMPVTPPSSAPAPVGRPAPAGAPAVGASVRKTMVTEPKPTKRIITADQAEYLKATGQWDPNRYEVR